MYSLQAIRKDGVEAAKSTKIEEALKQISSSAKAPTAFGHSRVDSNAAEVEKVARMDPSPWDDIVESWIKENEESNVSSMEIESYRRSHKNPFLADLNPDGESAAYKRSSNSFSFCVDSPSTSVSNGSNTDSTTDSTVTVLDGEKRAKILGVSLVADSSMDGSSADAASMGNGFHIDANVFKSSVEANQDKS